MMCQPGAIEDANQAVRLHPLCNELISRSTVLLTLMHPKEALADCNLAISKDPTNPLAYASRASVFLKINRSDDAKNDLEQAAKLGTNLRRCQSSYLLVVQSTYEAATLDFDKAISSVTQAIDLVSTYSHGYMNRGWYHILKKQPKHALTDLDIAELYDKSPMSMSTIQSTRSRAFTLQSDLTTAMEFANKGLDLNVRGTTLCARAICFFLIEDYINAMADLNKCIELEPYDLEALWLKAKILRLTGDDEQALEIEPKLTAFEHYLEI